MDIGGREKCGFHVIDVIGKIDRLKDSIVLRSYVNSLIEKKCAAVALNLSLVTYMDSGALNVLIYCQNALKKSAGTFAVIAPNEYVNDVLKVVGLDKVVTIYSTEGDFENECQKV